MLLVMLMMTIKARKFDRVFNLVDIDLLPELERDGDFKNLDSAPLKIVKVRLDMKR